MSTAREPVDDECFGRQGARPRIHAGHDHNSFEPGDIREDAFLYYSRLGRLKQSIEADLIAELSLRRAAQIACLEPKYFSAYFHRKVGVRYRDWLAWVRVQRAMVLLCERDTPITEIAARVGYGDLRSLERAFRRIAHVTPLEFRKHHRLLDSNHDK